MGRKIIGLVTAFIFSIALVMPVYASEVTEIIGRDKIYAVDKVSEEGAGISFSRITEDIISGETDISVGVIAEKVFGLLFSEIKDCVLMLKPLFIAALLSAVLKNLSSSFKSKAVSELGFYVCYMVMIFVVLDMFTLAGRVVTDTLGQLSDMLLATMPVFYTIMAVSGEYTGAYVTGTLVASAAALMSNIANIIIIPALGFGVSLEIVNNITEREQLGKMAELIKSGIKTGLKAASGGFMALLSLQKIGVSAMDKAAGKTVKALVGAVPVVGDVMTGAVESAAAMVGAVRSSSLVAVIIIMVVMCAIPVIKVMAVMVIYKVTAAVIEPISEKRFIKIISAVGDYAGLLLSTLFAALVMFVFSAIMLIGLV